MLGDSCLELGQQEGDCKLWSAGREFEFLCTQQSHFYCSTAEKMFPSAPKAWKLWTSSLSLKLGKNKYIFIQVIHRDPSLLWTMGLGCPFPFGLSTLNFFFFNWSIMALQCCVSFCLQQHESAIYKHISLPSWASLTPRSHPAPLGHHRAPGSSPWVIYSSFSPAILLTAHVYISVLLSQFVPFPGEIVCVCARALSVISNSLQPHEP